MKQTIEKAIINAHITEEGINTFIFQIALCAIFLGLYTHSWLVFGFTLLLPLAIFLFSGKVNWCRKLAIVLGILYALLWGCAGFLIGCFFSISASIVLCILFLIPGICYNWLAVDYFRGN